MKTLHSFVDKAVVEFLWFLMVIIEEDIPSVYIKRGLSKLEHAVYFLLCFVKEETL